MEIEADPTFATETSFASETTFDVENPLHVDKIPIANLVPIEVEAQPILDPKNESSCEKTWDYIQLVGAILILLGMLAGMILFMVWMFNPRVFGNNGDDF